jgi:hypothetical protein
MTSPLPYSYTLSAAFEFGRLGVTGFPALLRGHRQGCLHGRVQRGLLVHGSEVSC